MESARSMVCNIFEKIKFWWGKVQRARARLL